jgi:SAM-dependent methyltransferase
MKTEPYAKFAEVYDGLMNQGEFYSSYYHFILGKIKGKPKVLEIGCGTGKLANIFLEKGFDVEGLDISKEMLAVARKSGLRVHRQGMADFRLPGKYGLILSIFDSLNYLQNSAELRSCFRSVFKHLERGGLFIFDLNSDYKINSSVALFGSSTEYSVNGIDVIWNNSVSNNKWIADIKFTEGKNVFEEHHVETGFSLTETKQLLKEAGFKILASVSDFDSIPITETSLKWFFVCRKG